MMGILHQSRGKGNAAARTLGETMSASRATKQLEDSAVIEQIHDISQRPQFSGLSGELGVASSQLPIQAKLTIGPPNDRYEQEADRLASQVVQQINAPASVQSSQGQCVQRTEAPEEEEIQAKLESTSIQRKGAEAGGEAITDLTSAINSARGGGQPIADNIREPMEVAFGADFSGVKVHTDGQSHHLNQSIQARAFTTGQDIFFRQMEYNPGSRGGQELLAHELTHVVQQNEGKSIQRDPLKDAVIDKEREAIKDDVDSAMAKIQGALVTEVDNGEMGAKRELNNRGRDMRVYATMDFFFTKKTMWSHIKEWDSSKWSLKETAGLLLDMGLALRKVKNWHDKTKDRKIISQILRRGWGLRGRRWRGLLNGFLSFMSKVRGRTALRNTFGVGGGG